MKRLSWAALLVFALAACTDTGAGGNIEGVWMLTSFETGGEAHDVAIGANTEEQPWVQLDGEMTGSLGCNGFGGGYTYSNGVLTPLEVFSELRGCFGETLDDDAMMTTEVLIQGAFLWSGGSIGVSVSNEIMTWSAGASSLTWTRIDAPPSEPTLPPQTGFQRLECAPNLVEREIVPADGNSFDTYQDSGQELISTLPGVTTFEQEDPTSLVWFGYGDGDDAIVAVSFDDISPKTFSIWTCP